MKGFIGLVFAVVLLSSPVLAADRLTRILEAAELRVCVWPDYYSISYRDPRTGVLRGIDVDLARAMADDLGVQIRFVDSSFARLVEDVSADRCDIAMFGIGITPERQRHLRFTSPHLQSDVYAITTRSNRRVRDWEDIDRQGVVVAVTRGTLHERLMKERLHQARLQILETGVAREQEVEAGRADVFMTDFPYSLRMLEHVEWARLIVPPRHFHLTPYAWAMLPGDDVWHQRVEDFLVSVRKDGRLLRYAERHKLDPIVVLSD